MNEIINRILDGKFEYDNGSLDFSRSKIELTLMQGESYEGSFTIIGSKDRIIEGYIYSSDSRMKCMSEHFSGTTEEVSFVFDGNGLEEGDVIKGTINKITSFGAFIYIYPGVEALLPSAEIADGQVNINAMFNLGDEVDVLIKKFTPQEHRIGLSIKDIQK